MNWIAHNWGAENPYRQYHSCIAGLEKMLNWSFAHGLSLVDWRRKDFENYAEFVDNLPKARTVPGTQACFVQEAGIGNVAAQPLPNFAFKQPKAIGFLTDYELEWVLKSLPNFMGVHEFRIIEMYLIMARHSGRQLWSIRAPGHLDQFNRRSDGRWI